MRTRGFKLGRRICRVFKWVIRPRRKQPGYNLLLQRDPKTNHQKSKTMTKICNLGRFLKRGAKGLCFSSHKPKSKEYALLGHDDPFHNPKPVSVPKGHLAVYVGDKDDDYRRVLVPVIYFNHPLFGELLREAEKKYGYEHPGGITIPCQISEFENVKTRIAAGRR